MLLYQEKYTRDIQGGLFNWPPPKNHKFKKKLKYPDWPPPKSSKCQPVSNCFLRKSKSIHTGPYLNHLGQRDNSEKEHDGSPIGKHCHSRLAPIKGILSSTLNWTPGIPDNALHQSCYEVSGSSKIDIIQNLLTWWHAIPQKSARIYQRLVYTRSSGKSSVLSTLAVS